MLRALGRLSIYGLITIVCVEISCALYLHLLPWPHSAPAYSVTSATSTFWVDINKEFGVWHGPNTTYRHRRSCYAVDYRANSYGARDVERRTRGDRRRTVVLGDSFVEGFGVPDGKRLTDLLETETGRAHLNFGTGGNFGPLQYYLLYKSMASRFSHDRVLIGVLPANDFTDNDLDSWKGVDRYRPYYAADGAGFRVVYRGRFDPDPPRPNPLKGLIREFSATYHVLRAIKNKILFRRSGAERGSGTISRFYDFTPAQLESLERPLREIARLAAERGATTSVFLIPARQDFGVHAARVSDGGARPGTTPLGAALKAWGAEEGIRVVDLLPSMYAREPQTHAGYFQTCDPHWSVHGNAIAGEILHDRLYRDTGADK